MTYRNFAFLIIFLFSSQLLMSQAFTTKWVTTRDGFSNENTIVIGTNVHYNYFYDVDIDGDNEIDYSNVTGELVIEFDEPGIKTISIYGHFPMLSYLGYENAEINKLVEVISWGDIEWENLSYMFAGCDSLVISAIDAPDLSEVQYLDFTFSDIDHFVGDLNHWDVSGVETMRSTFFKNPTFNSPLDLWDVGNVTIMRSTFEGCTEFNQDISTWDVSKVSVFCTMFKGATNFNSEIKDWNPDSLVCIGGMFQDAESFNQDLSLWDTEHVYSFSSMFENAKAFNGDISGWNVSNGVVFWDMFNGATSFNRDIGAWDMASVSFMGRMFMGATSFDQDITSWNPKGQMNSVFDGATSFNQDLSQWDFLQALNLRRFVAKSGLDVENYDRLLVKMKEINKSAVDSFGIGLLYCEAEEERQYLIDSLGWTELHDAKDCFVSTEELPISKHSIYSSTEGLHVQLLTPIFRETDLFIYNSVGNLNRAITISSERDQYLFDTSDMRSGIYFVHIGDKAQKVYIHGVY